MISSMWLTDLKGKYKLKEKNILNGTAPSKKANYNINVIPI